MCQEAYDYIGSGRMVYDMEHGVFPTTQKEQGDKDAASPVSLDNIQSFIEVSQVGLGNTFSTQIGMTCRVQAQN